MWAQTGTTKYLKGYFQLYTAMPFINKISLLLSKVRQKTNLVVTVTFKNLCVNDL